MAMSVILLGRSIKESSMIVSSLLQEYAYVANDMFCYQFPLESKMLL